MTEYDDRNFSNLDYTGNDAEGMAKALTQAGFASVRVLTNKRGEKDKKDAPTAENVRAELKALLAKRTRHDTVLVCLAGHGMQLEVVKLPEAKRGFVLLPRRWVVERSFGWLARFRRLARDYERLPETVEGLTFVAFACLMLHRAIHALGS